MQKRIFITGAAGFVGFHVARALAQRGDVVLGYDNFNHYYTPQLKHQRAALLQAEGVKVLEGDICDAVALAVAIKNHSPTHILHLAAQAGVRYSITHPHIYAKTNIEGFLNILEICRESPAIKLIYASSSSVYGNNGKVPFSINDPTDHQASFYGVTKKSNELMAQTYHHLYGIHVTGLRFFTVYGPWGRPDMAYFSFTKAILEGQPIELFDEGKLVRDFTYIDDIVQGTVAAIDLGAECELFNLGNHRPVEVRHFVAIIEDALGKKAKIINRPMQAGDVPITYADIDHSIQRLGFCPKTPLEVGIPQFVAWYVDEAKGGEKGGSRKGKREG